MIRAKQQLGKYRIERKLGEGGFAAVYRALDTVEGIRVALKIPFRHLLSEDVLEDFRREIRIAARLNHPHILPLKNAEMVDDRLVVAFPLGERTLTDRMRSRIATKTALELAEQLLDAVAYAHHQRIIHCDIKPDNLILFPDNQLMLTDFGIAKVAMKTVRASGSGTIGYIAPEQAMGKPSFRSDVFACGLIIYRMLAGQLPEWPYEWPPPGFSRLQRRLHPDLIDLLRRAIELDPRKRYQDGEQMLAALRRVKGRALRYRTRAGHTKTNGAAAQDWRTVQRRQFQREFGKLLETGHRCGKCEGPISETMPYCPWCGVHHAVHRGGTTYPQQCPRCQRGLKLDWHYCPWCYGPGFEVTTTRQYSDERYSARCLNPRCQRKLLMPFMRYCPWCRRKVQRRWKIPGVNDRCSSCRWGVIKAFWSFCPWCGKSIIPTQKGR